MRNSRSADHQLKATRQHRNTAGYQYGQRRNTEDLSDRIGHSDMSVTFQVYGHRSTGHDREAAELVAKLIREALEVRWAGGELRHGH